MSEILISEQMPILALRGLTVFPKQMLHFDVGREKSVKALELAMKGDQRIFLVTQKNILDDEPTEKASLPHRHGGKDQAGAAYPGGPGSGPGGRGVPGLYWPVASDRALFVRPGGIRAGTEQRCRSAQSRGSDAGSGDAL